MPRADADLLKRMRFFQKYMGGVVGERAKGALDLARAERRAEELGWTVTFEPEEERYEDVYGEAPPEGAEFYAAILWDTDPESSEFRRLSRREQNAHILETLGFVDDIDPRGYGRLVAAELADQALARGEGS